MTVIHKGGPRDAACMRKVAYRRFHSAIYFARRSMAHRPETQLFVYRCDQCGLFHLTSHPGYSAVEVMRREA